jgi:hypothetical protein
MHIYIYIYIHMYRRMSGLNTRTCTYAYIYTHTQVVDSLIWERSAEDVWVRVVKELKTIHPIL